MQNRSSLRCKINDTNASFCPVPVGSRKELQGHMESFGGGLEDRPGNALEEEEEAAA